MGRPRGRERRKDPARAQEDLQTLAPSPEGPTPGPQHGPRDPRAAGALEPEMGTRGDTHMPSRQCAADSTKFRAIRVAPQKWRPRLCRDAMKGHACGLAGRPPTISEASAGPGGKGGGGGERRGGAPPPPGKPHPPSQDPTGSGSCRACRPERGGGLHGPPARAQLDLDFTRWESPETPLFRPHHSGPQPSPYPNCHSP